MATTKRPRFQNRGPDWRCKHDRKELDWSACTAYAMAIGVDVWDERCPDVM
jgi:hypothetical protein